MHEPLKHPALSLLASAMLALLPMAGLTGCAGGATDDDVDVKEVRQQTITAETLAGLKPGEQLVLDQREAGITYTFDFSKAPIDFSRITMIHNNGAAQPMDKWLSVAKANGRDLLASPDHTFQLSPSAQGFAYLSVTESSQLQSTGKLMKKADVSSLATGAVSAQDTVCHTEYYWLCFCGANGWCWCDLYSYEVCEETEP